MQFTKFKAAKSLESITASFTQVVDELNFLIQSNQTQQENLIREIDDKRATVQAVREESEKAAKIKANIEKLIG